MFGLTFLSSEKKKTLEKLQNRLSHALTPIDRSETQLMIQEIMNHAKLLKNCDIAEADELRIQLLSKINILAGLGKLDSIEVFRMHLTDVEFHIATKQMEEKLLEERKMKQPDEAPNQKDKSPTVNSLKRDKKKKQAFGHPRWVIGFEDEPDGTNK